MHWMRRSSLPLPFGMNRIMYLKLLLWIKYTDEMHFLSNFTACIFRNFSHGYSAWKKNVMVPSSLHGQNQYSVFLLLFHVCLLGISLCHGKTEFTKSNKYSGKHVLLLYMFLLVQRTEWGADLSFGIPIVLDISF